MILLYFRTIFVALIFLVLPFVISSIVALFTLAGVQIILLSIFGIISFVLFVFIVHLNSTLEIFVEATWYEAYCLCKEEDKLYAGGYDDHHGDTHDSHDDNQGHDDHHDAHHH
jgi:energy-coupling factor transporter transmembrane protein EcfT